MLSRPLVARFYTPASSLSLSLSFSLRLSVFNGRFALQDAFALVSSLTSLPPRVSLSPSCSVSFRFLRLRRGCLAALSKRAVNRERHVATHQRQPPSPPLVEACPRVRDICRRDPPKRWNLKEKRRGKCHSSRSLSADAPAPPYQAARRDK